MEKQCHILCIRSTFCPTLADYHVMKYSQWRVSPSRGHFCKAYRDRDNTLVSVESHRDSRQDCKSISIITLYKHKRVKSVCPCRALFLPSAEAIYYRVLLHSLMTAIVRKDFPETQCAVKRRRNHHLCAICCSAVTGKNIGNKTRACIIGVTARCVLYGCILFCILSPYFSLLMTFTSRRMHYMCMCSWLHFAVN